MNNVPSAGSRKCSLLRSRPGSGPRGVGGVGSVGTVGGLLPGLLVGADAPEVSAVPSWKGGRGHRGGASRRGGVGGAGEAACPTGLPLPRDDPQTWQQHEDARPHPYLARRFCGPCRGLRPRCVIRRGQEHLPKEMGSAGPAPHASPSGTELPPALPQEPGSRPSRVAPQSHLPTSPTTESLLRSGQGTLRSFQLKKKQTTRIHLSFLPGNCNRSRCWAAGRTLGR